MTDTTLTVSQVQKNKHGNKEKKLYNACVYVFDKALEMSVDGGAANECSHHSSLLGLTILILG